MVTDRFRLTDQLEGLRKGVLGLLELARQRSRKRSTTLTETQHKSIHQNLHRKKRKGGFKGDKKTR